MHCALYNLQCSEHCAKKNMIISIKTEPFTAGADASVYTVLFPIIWSRKPDIYCTVTMIGSVFMRRFDLFLGRFCTCLLFKYTLTSCKRYSIIHRCIYPLMHYHKIAKKFFLGLVSWWMTGQTMWLSRGMIARARATFCLHFSYSGGVPGTERARLYAECTLLPPPPPQYTVHTTSICTYYQKENVHLHQNVSYNYSGYLQKYSHL